MSDPIKFIYGSGMIMLSLSDLTLYRQWKAFFVAVGVRLKRTMEKHFPNEHLFYLGMEDE